MYWLMLNHYQGFVVVWEFDMSDVYVCVKLL